MTILETKEITKTEKGNEYQPYRTPNPLVPGSGLSQDVAISRASIIDDLVRRNIIEVNMAAVLKAYLAPKNHPSHMTLNDAVLTFYPNENVAKIRTHALTACAEIVKDLWYGEYHENTRRAKEADSQRKHKRSRTKEEIARHKALAEAEKNARKKLGIPQTIPFPALSEYDQLKLIAELKHNN